MSPLSCSSEREVADLMHRGYWPDACPDELRAHVASCRSCSDLVLVTQTFQAARKETAQLPSLESAGALWWRAQLRRRNDALERVARPIFGAQIFALVMVALLIAASIAWQGGTLRAWMQNLPWALHFDALVPASLLQSGGLTWIILSIFATVALLSGIVVYLTEKQ